ncbi:MAG: hypothetical protein LKK00_01020 [Intestinimonas sp.]|jgi:hypothetical protein|nr:hypothetical protein [Intestinimonas sp.]
MTQKQVMNEIKYRMARNFLVSLLKQGKITSREYEKAEEYAVKKYRPILRSI